MIVAKNICKRFGKIEVLRGVNLEIAESQVLGIVGSSGAGKTTLLQILSTLETMDSGQLTIGGLEPAKMRAAQLAEFRNQKLGFVFQFHNLLPEFTALENVMMPGLIAGQSKGQLKDRARELLAMLGMASLSGSMAGALSGGEQQRVAVARALMNKPMVIFADEPSGNLDSKNAEALHDLFFELRKNLGQTIVLVTHNSALAQRCDRVITMADGLIVGDQASLSVS